MSWLCRTNGANRFQQCLLGLRERATDRVDLIELTQIPASEFVTQILDPNDKALVQLQRF